MKKDSIHKPKHTGRGGNNISFYPLTPDEAIKGILSISPADAKRIRESSKPKYKRK